MKIRFLAAAALLGILGTSHAQNHATLGSQAAIAEAEDQVRHEMKDPSSVQFRNVSYRATGTLEVVCGEYNAKNSYGGYVGFKIFVDMPGTGSKPDMESADPGIELAFLRLVKAECTP